MATETRDQSASLAEVFRSFFTDPTGLPQSKNEDISCSQTRPNARGNQPFPWTVWQWWKTDSSQPANLQRNHWKEIIVERAYSATDINAFPVLADRHQQPGRY